jgi:hypothetical protein
MHRNSSSAQKLNGRVHHNDASLLPATTELGDDIRVDYVVHHDDQLVVRIGGG